MIKFYLLSLGITTIVSFLGSLWDKYYLIPKGKLSETRKLVGNFVEGALIGVTPVISFIIGKTIALEAATLWLICMILWWTIHDVFMALLLKQHPLYVGKGNFDQKMLATFQGSTWLYFGFKVFWIVFFTLIFFAL